MPLTLRIWWMLMLSHLPGIPILFRKNGSMSVIDLFIAGDLSRCKACSLTGNPPYHYRQFKTAIKKVDDLENDNALAPFKANRRASKIHLGCPSTIGINREDLSWLVIDTRQKGIQVGTHLLHQETSRLLPLFRSKIIDAKKNIINHFTKQLGLTCHAATHTAQKHTQETEEESKHFIALKKHKIMGRGSMQYHNFNQTPIPYSYHSHKMLKAKGSKTIHARASTTDTNQHSPLRSIPLARCFLAYF